MQTSASRLSIISFSLLFCCVLALPAPSADLASQRTAPYSSDLLDVAWIVEQLDKTATDPNLCAGGLENGKQIVAEAYLRNPFRETTRLACEVDGGNPLKVPDLPAPDDRATRLA